MRLPFADHFIFFRQFRERFKTTGAIAPSSGFLARAMTGPLKQHAGPTRILEIGPGTGAVTRHIVRAVKEHDRFDLVELNERFAGLLQDRFRTDPTYARVADRSEVHVCPLQEFKAEAPYDIVISGLPLNNFPADLVRTIFKSYFDLLAPGGVLSYFEYMYVRPMRKSICRGAERERLTSLDETMNSYIEKHRFKKSWVFVNLPPAWVQHLRKDADESASDTSSAVGSETK
ncbi:MAG: methyltransferase domain-containing protein [Planctomycetota bacterium]|nr:methyltransferase domain-containing protein [Planctomycetota bacterium]